MPTRFIPSPSLVKAKILPIKRNGKRPPNAENLGTFLINPSTWSEKKDAKWIKHDIPGLSDPHQQWISSGARTITFEALVSNDLAKLPPREPERRAICMERGATGIVTSIGGIAAQIFGIPGLTAAEAIEQSGNSTRGTNVKLDIREKLAFYRSLVYPNTPADRTRVSGPPNLVELVVGTTLGLRTLQGAKFVVDSVEITYTKQLPDLTPIEARVTFRLTEFVDRLIASDTDVLGQ